MSSDGKSQSLLPRIPDDITLNGITSKLSWKDFYILSSVSRAWCHAIRSRQVYNSRVRCQSTETLVLTNFGSGRHFDLCLYSLRDNFWYEIPPIPTGNPLLSTPISLQGKIYVLGGFTAGQFRFAREVYVFDLAGQGQWQRCADMIEPRVMFGCGAVEGKIYIFGGLTGSFIGNTVNLSPIRESEVYDPKENIWSPIKPMISMRSGHRVDAVGEGLVVHGGSFLREDMFESRYHWVSNDGDHAGLFWESYNPAKDEWTLVDPLWRQSEPIYFASQGEIHAMSEKTSIYVPIIGEDSWKQVHSSLLSSIQVGDYPASTISPHTVLVVGGELVAIVWWSSIDRTRSYSLLRSAGFGSKTEMTKWHELEHFELAFETPDFPIFLRPIQL